MDQYALLVFGCLMISFVLILKFQRVHKSYISILFKAFVLLGIVKYITLFIFYNSSSPNNLYEIRFLTLLSSISLFACSYIAIKFSLKNKFNYKCFIPFIITLIFGSVIILNLPIGITKGDIGYIITKDDKFLYLELAYLILTNIWLVAMAIRELIKGNNVYKKTVLIIYTIAYIVGIIECSLFIINKNIYSFNIISDVAVLLSLLIGSIIMARKNKKVVGK